MDVGTPHQVSRHTDFVISVPIETENIRLAQLLKLANLVQDGAEAKFLIANKEVRVNGVVEIRRGRKLRNGDRVEFDGRIYEVVRINS